MKFDMEAEGVEQVRAKLIKARRNLNGDMVKWATRSGSRVQVYAKKHRFRMGGSGVGGSKRMPPIPGILTSRGGSKGLRDHILYQVEQQGNDIICKVGVPDWIKHGRIHEFGGMAGRNHASRIPKRPYLGISLDKERQNINADFEKTAKMVLRKAGLN